MDIYITPLTNRRKSEGYAEPFYKKNIFFSVINGGLFFVI